MAGAAGRFGAIRFAAGARLAGVALRPAEPRAGALAVVFFAAGRAAALAGFGRAGALAEGFRAGEAAVLLDRDTLLDVGLALRFDAGDAFLGAGRTGFAAGFRAVVRLAAVLTLAACLAGGLVAAFAG